MNKPKVFIDGQAGTTGLQIYERLAKRQDIELIQIDPSLRKDAQTRRRCYQEADLIFLCLPDAASREAVKLAEGMDVKIIDASTAFRTEWVYGFPELFREQIRTAKKVANPGCHASGFIAITAPLVQNNLIDPNQEVHAFSLTGYSGGGKKMIQEYEEQKSEALMAPRIYGLNRQHKHLPEMKKIAGLKKTPLFTPIVDDYYNGMLVSIQVARPVQKIYDTFVSFYQNEPLIEVIEPGKETMLSANAMKDSDHLKIYVNGNDEQTIVSASFDNLGKGACGSAIQNMNIMLGFDEFESLR